MIFTKFDDSVTAKTGVFTPLYDAHFRAAAENPDLPADMSLTSVPDQILTTPAQSRRYNPS